METDKIWISEEIKLCEDNCVCLMFINYNCSSDSCTEIAQLLLARALVASVSQKIPSFCWYYYC